MLGVFLQGTLFLLAMAASARALIMGKTSSFWAGYCDQLRKRPILTKAATGVVGSLIGDGVAQYSSSRSVSRSSNGPMFSYDAARAARLCGYSAVIGSPIGHYWFQFLDKFIFPNAMGHPMTAVVKTLLDQVIMAPAGIGLFFCAMSMLEGNSLQEAWASTKQKFAPTLKANYLLWPAANLVNFAFVPPAQRILYCNVVYIFWASYLSAMASKKGSSEDEMLLEPVYLAQKEL